MDTGGGSEAPRSFRCPWSELAPGIVIISSFGWAGADPNLSGRMSHVDSEMRGDLAYQEAPYVHLLLLRFDLV